jgi:long-chain acyl-CoA synthetase
MSMVEAHARLTAADSPFAIERRVIDGVSQRCWVHTPATARQLLIDAAAHDARDFLVFEDERVSVAAFRRAVSALAHHLRHSGVRPGDRVAIAMRNLPEWPVVFFAALSIGGLATALNAWWQHAELAYALEHSGATHLFADVERLNRLGALPTGVCCYAVRGAMPGATSLTDIIGMTAQWDALRDHPLPAVSLEADDAATIFFTSGTSGKPKGVLASHRAMLSNITGAAFAGARASLRDTGTLPVAEPNAAQGGALMAVPFFHVTGAFAVLSPALHAGNKLVLTHRWDAGEALRLIERERLNWIIGVPTMMLQLADHPDAATCDLTSLVSLGYGGAAAAPDLVGRLASAVPQAVPGHGWGMTETCGLTLTHSGNDYRQRSTSCGAPVAVARAEIRGEDGRCILPADQVGELWVFGPNVMRGYWNDPAATAAVLQGGWLRTGDLARIDAEGFVHIVDRAKDIVIRGGENVFCIEVENCLYEHPAVRDAALVGRPDHMLGEVPVAVVVLRDGAKARGEELRAHVAARLAAFKVPVEVVLSSTPLPRNAAGKLLKRDILVALGQRDG